jgi:hypothetical protein
MSDPKPHSTTVSATDFESVDSGSNPDVAATPYLIAHLVRGEPAFDIAERMQCPKCDHEHGAIDCDDPHCDLGYWWIIPTSGHRAYPWWNKPLHEIVITLGLGCSCTLNVIDRIFPPPPNLPDHYANQPAAPGRGITNLSFLRPKLPTITRRL